MKDLYSANLTKASLKVAESRIVAALLIDGADESAWRQAIVEENVLQKRSVSTARTFADYIRHRLSTMHRGLWELVRDGSPTVATQALLAAAIKHNRLLADFFDLVLCEHHRQFKTTITDRDWADYIESCAGRDPNVATWTPAVVMKLRDELTPDITHEQLVAHTDHEKDIQRLVSYFVGCIMGRYSLDTPGRIYAHSGNQGFDPECFIKFPVDDDGILPVTSIDWFGNDDITNCFIGFLKVAWSEASLAQNLTFVADSLRPKSGEAPHETIRRYLCTEFYKFHLQMYKRRPIYWLFSSGKERAFQALVYLHRYNEGTLARMRMDYVVPLQSRMSARIDQLREDIAASVTTADRKKREKEREKLLRQLDELRIFDEKLRHYADMRISLDLDDGVKVNYGKFGDLLAEVKAVTGGSDE